MLYLQFVAGILTANLIRGLTVYTWNHRCSIIGHRWETCGKEIPSEKPENMTDIQWEYLKRVHQDRMCLRCLKYESDTE